MGRELVTLVVQHADVKSGKSVTASVLTSDVTAGHTALVRRGRRPRLPGGAKLRCIADASDVFGSGMVCTKNPDQPARQRTGPELNGQVSVYCWPMIFPLMSMLSSTTMLEPASGPPSWTRWMLFTLLPAGMAGTVCAGLAGSKRKRFHPATGAG